MEKNVMKVWVRISLLLVVLSVISLVAPLLLTRFSFLSAAQRTSDHPWVSLNNNNVATDLGLAANHKTNNTMSNASNNIDLTAVNGIEWDRNQSLWRTFGFSRLMKNKMELNSQRGMTIFYQAGTAGTQGGQAMKPTHLITDGDSKLMTDRLQSTAQQIEMFFAPDAQKLQTDVVSKMLFRGQVVLQSTNNNTNKKSLVLRATTAMTYRDKASHVQLTHPQPRDVVKNPFAELQARGGVVLEEGALRARGQSLIWYMDDAIGWLYAPTVVVESGQSMIYATRALEYNQQESVAVARDGVRVKTRADVVTGQRGYYLGKQNQAVICGQARVVRARETLQGECATINLISGRSVLEGNNIESNVINAIGNSGDASYRTGVGNISLPTDQQKANKAAVGSDVGGQVKKTTKPVEKGGRVRAIIEMQK